MSEPENESVPGEDLVIHAPAAVAAAGADMPGQADPQPGTEQAGEQPDGVD